MQVGDRIHAEHDGHRGTGIVEAVDGGQVLLRLTVRSPDPWTSPVTGGTVPAGCPVSYLLWLPTSDLRLAAALRG